MKSLGQIRNSEFLYLFFRYCQDSEIIKLEKFRYFSRNLLFSQCPVQSFLTSSWESEVSTRARSIETRRLKLDILYSCE